MIEPSTTISVSITGTPDRNTSASDVNLGATKTPNGAKGWAPINAAAKPKTNTGKDSSKRK